MAELRVDEFVTEVLVEGSGPPVVLCHGSASDRRTWTDQREVLQEAGFQVVSYSRRYHWPNPQSPDETSYSMTQHVDDLVALLDQLQLAPVAVVGHSYGGFIALLAARQYPDRFTSLTLIEPPVVPLFLSDPPKPKEVVRVLFRRPSLGLALIKFGATGLVPATKAASANDMDEAIQIFGKAVLGKQAFEHLSPERFEQVQANNIRAEYLSESFDPITSDEVRSIDTPVLLISGDESPRLWRLLTKYLHELLPNSTLVGVPNASHIVHEDNPTEFNHELLKFLAS